MAKARVIWAPAAKEDLRSVHDYIAQRTRREAKAFTNRIKKSVARLRMFPELGSRVEDVEVSDYREIYVGPCRVIYRWAKPIVRIVAVIRGTRLLRPEDLPS
jgi:addiction module RelE/StbE family toxin